MSTKTDYVGKTYSYEGKTKERIVVDDIPNHPLNEVIKNEMGKMEDFLLNNPFSAPKRLIQALREVSMNLGDNLPFLGYKNFYDYMYSPNSTQRYLVYSRMMNKKIKKLSELIPDWLSCSGGLLWVVQVYGCLMNLNSWKLYNNAEQDRRGHVKLAREFNNNMIIIDPPLSRELRFRFVMPMEEFFKENVPSKFLENQIAI